MLVDVEVTRRAADRFVARALHFPDLVVEATSREAALASVRTALIARRRAGVEIVQIALDDAPLTPDGVWPTHAGAFADDAAYQEMLAAVDRERRALDAASA